jgi:hypothetical protein
MKYMKSTTIFLTISLGLLTSGQVFGEIVRSQINSENLIVRVKNEPWQPQGFDNGLVIPATHMLKPAVIIDGKDDELVWRDAQEVEVPLFYGNVESVSLKALYTDDEVFIRVRWADDTESREHKPWKWSAANERWVTGPQIEDSVMLSFEAGCEWAPSLIEGYDYDFDAWHWLAARTDPLGQALDIGGTVKDRDMSTPDPSGSMQDQEFYALNSIEYQSRHQDPVWALKFIDDDLDNYGKKLILPWDMIDRAYLMRPFSKTMFVIQHVDNYGMASKPEFFRQLPPPVDTPEDSTQTHPQYLPQQLHGGAGEVAAKGQWQDGFWTVEFRRIRITPARNINDTILDRLTQFSVYAFDQVVRIDEASESGRLFLQFLPAEKLLVEE